MSHHYGKLEEAEKTIQIERKRRVLGGGVKAHEDDEVLIRRKLEIDQDDVWTQWKIQHEVPSMGVVEEVIRYELFQEKDKWIEEHNQFLEESNGSYRVGHNILSGLTQSELDSLTGGLVELNSKETESIRNHPQHQTQKLAHFETMKQMLKSKKNKTRPRRNLQVVIDEEDDSSDSYLGPIGADGLPSSVDWRKFDAVTDVKNQGQCGACWSFAATAALEGLMKIRSGLLISLSEEQLLECDTDPFQQGCKGGNFYYSFLHASSTPVATAEDYPYTYTKGHDEVYECQLGVSAQGIVNGGSSNGGVVFIDNTEQALKEAVSIQPVAVGINGYSDAFKYYKSGVLDNAECTSKIDHAVTIVGYGTTSDTNEDFWLVKNQWSYNWGDNGYIKIARNSGQAGGMCGILVQANIPTGTSCAVSDCSSFQSSKFCTDTQGCINSTVVIPDEDWFIPNSTFSLVDEPVRGHYLPTDVNSALIAVAFLLVFLILVTLGYIVRVRFAVLKSNGDDITCHNFLYAPGPKLTRLSKVRERKIGKWTPEQVKALKRAAKKFPRTIERAQRWQLIAEELGEGRTESECYNKYRQLKLIAAKKAEMKEKEKLAAVEAPELSTMTRRQILLAKSREAGTKAKDSFVSARDKVKQGARSNWEKVRQNRHVIKMLGEPASSSSLSESNLAAGVGSRRESSDFGSNDTESQGTFVVVPEQQEESWASTMAGVVQKVTTGVIGIFGGNANDLDDKIPSVDDDDDDDDDDDIEAHRPKSMVRTTAVSDDSASTNASNSAGGSGRFRVPGYLGRKKKDNEKKPHEESNDYDDDDEYDQDAREKERQMEIERERELERIREARFKEIAKQEQEKLEREREERVKQKVLEKQKLAEMELSRKQQLSQKELEEENRRIKVHDAELMKRDEEIQGVMKKLSTLERVTKQANQTNRVSQARKIESDARKVAEEARKAAAEARRQAEELKREEEMARQASLKFNEKKNDQVNTSEEDRVAEKQLDDRINKARRSKSTKTSGTKLHESIRRIASKGRARFSKKDHRLSESYWEEDSGSL